MRRIRQAQKLLRSQLMVKGFSFRWTILATQVSTIADDLSAAIMDSYYCPYRRQCHRLVQPFKSHRSAICNISDAEKARVDAVR
jgi:hypothetical protein